ncbi:vWA domain-containing protein [Phaeospirillum tilakii]|uniref:RNA-binding protein n=1 Tax=Phaeospirillum tilakii TaxID=741673 RepID=A0ABW5C742_9PROT
MANKSLFASALARLLPRADSRNAEGAPAYAYGPEARLAHLAATGTLADTFYGTAEAQLADVVAAARAVDPLFVAKAAVYARRFGAMKDMPALLAAYLTTIDPVLAARLFHRVIDSGRMLRTYVQILRSGQVGRSSLGTRPKRLVQHWLEQATIEDLMAAATGTAPSLKDIVRMVHPRPADPERRAFYGWLLDRPYDVAALPEPIAAFEAWKPTRDGALPPVPFSWLVGQALTPDQWGELALRMGAQALRLNLNTLARQGAFRVPGVAEAVAARLEAADRALGQPYQMMMALKAVGAGVPLRVQAALETVLERALAVVPRIEGAVVVCPDVSGSMSSPLTGHRRGATTAVRCVDVAALIASALLRSNPEARVLPFEHRVVSVRVEATARIAVNAARLAAVGGGGTNVSAPLVQLERERARVDLIVIVSDNQSWVDARTDGATATMRAFRRLQRRNPGLRLVCIDLQPHGSTQAASGADILNVGGFSDAVFETMARFARGESRDWVGEIDRMEV